MAHYKQDKSDYFFTTKTCTHFKQTLSSNVFEKYVKVQTEFPFMDYIFYSYNSAFTLL